MQDALSLVLLSCVRKVSLQDPRACSGIAIATAACKVQMPVPGTCCLLAAVIPGSHASLLLPVLSAVSHTFLLAHTTRLRFHKTVRGQLPKA